MALRLLSSWVGWEGNDTANQQPCMVRLACVLAGGVSLQSTPRCLPNVHICCSTNASSAESLSNI